MTLLRRDLPPAEIADVSDRGPSVVFRELPPSGKGPLVRAAHLLLMLAATLRTSPAADDVTRLWNRATLALRDFESRAADAHVGERAVATAHYVLCALIDEAVLRSPWGPRSPWHRKSLLMAHHGDTYGGETFFVILDRVCMDVERHVHLAELMEACLALGFGGRHLLDAEGPLRLGERRDDLHRRLASSRPDVPCELSPAWTGLVRPRRAKSWLFRLFLWGACLGVTGIGVVLHREAAGLRARVADRLSVLRYPSPPTPSSVPTVRVLAPMDDLRHWLRAEGAVDGVDVFDASDGRIGIRLASQGGFAPGTSTMSPPDRARVARLARAIDHLNGPVAVVGHSDDQPIRSSRFTSNAALSLARARSVASILAANLRDVSRIRVRGAADSEPIATPPDLPANRERNRRVDILLSPEAP
ncbi:type IVB secretion system protein IcmH/DotU [Luteibacter sp. PPL552]